VGKVKSKKLVLKDDEVDSDSDRKGKTNGRKKPAAGTHSSQGAYMLVYTLDKYVKDPEPDPPLYPFLDSLVKKEDQAFENEFKKSKNNKV
jgi:hypothetical protein